MLRFKDKIAQRVKEKFEADLKQNEEYVDRCSGGDSNRPEWQEKIGVWAKEAVQRECSGDGGVS